MKGVVNYNYYTALLFDRRPDLHMTVQYYCNLTPRKLGQLIVNVNDLITDSDLRQFKIKLDIEDFFGPKHTVRVLRPHELLAPPWLLAISKENWSPHISCKDNALMVKADTLVIMTKRREIVRWNLLK